MSETQFMLYKYHTKICIKYYFFNALEEHSYTT